MLQTVMSAANGTITFQLRPNVTYTLTELTPPSGYQPIATTYTIVADALGRFLINGEYVTSLRIENQPTNSASFTFAKTDATGGALGGAVFTLSQNGGTVGTATSTATGSVTFSGLSTGTYTMVETTPPSGYEANTTTYSVVVASNGTVTINGTAASAFSVANTPIPTAVSDPPTTNSVFTNNSIVTGLGIAGSTITIIWPGGSVSTASVGANGIWSVMVPGGVTLTVGQTISAFQIETNKLPSTLVTTTVLPLT